MEIARFSGTNMPGVMWLKIGMAKSFPTVSTTDAFSGLGFDMTSLFTINGKNSDNTVTFSEEAETTEAGIMYNWLIDIVVPRDAVEITKALHAFMHEPLIALVENFNHTSRMVGDVNFPLTMKYKFDVNPNAFAVQITGGSYKPALYLPGDLT